jgi:hypothetical protein
VLGDVGDLGDGAEGVGIRSLRTRESPQGEDTKTCALSRYVNDDGAEV